MTSSLLIVAGEAFPLAKTGGLADAVAGLSEALLQRGVPLHVLLPAYRGARSQVRIDREWVLDGLPGGAAHVFRGQCRSTGLPCLLLDNPALFDRPGCYVDENGADYADNAQRFAALAHTAAAVTRGLPGLQRPTIVHAHDWHAGLVPLLVKAANPAVRTIMTIHNLAFHGSFPLEKQSDLKLPPALEAAEGLTAWGRLNFLQAGIAQADRVTTVSRNYALEVLEEAGGCGLHPALRARGGDFRALPNGIDTRIWNPAADPFLGEGCFDVHTLGTKAVWKSRLQKSFGLNQDRDALLVVSCSRLTEQKMADWTADALPAALEALPNVQFAVLGQGAHRIAQTFQDLAQRYPGRCAVRISYDEMTAHRLHAGADVLWHPSRFEPFGLAPLYAMRYGTLPVATRVGGLVDTIHDPGQTASATAMMAATGLLFEPDEPQAMQNALARVLNLRDNEVIWRAMRRNAMQADFGWPQAVKAYQTLFAELEGRLPALQAARGVSRSVYRPRPSVRDSATALHMS